MGYTAEQAERFEYFVSFGVMTANINRFGHSFMMISAIDHAQGPNAQVEVLDAIGLYSSYMPVLGFKPIGQGTIVEEKSKFIADQNGLSHKTFKITQEEMAKILTSINEDRRMLGDKPSILRDNQYRPGGPVFNLFKGDNCKRYALKKLEDIGIDVKTMHSVMEIPKNSGNLHALKVKKTTRDDKDVFYWDCPLVLSSRQKRHVEQTHVTVKSFGSLLKGSENILNLLKERQDTLRQQGKSVEEIDMAVEKLNILLDEMYQIQSYPNQITQEKVQDWAGQLENTTLEGVYSLFTKGIEQTFAGKWLDMLKEVAAKLYAQWSKPSTLNDVAGNRYDQMVFNEASQISNKLR